MKIGIILQARKNSTRFPGKILEKFSGNKSLLEFVLDKVSTLDYHLVVATTYNDDEVAEICKSKNIDFYRGSENNVLKRFIEAAEMYQLDNLIRICSDNPFISVEYLTNLVESHLTTAADYTSYWTSDKIPTIKTHYGFFTEIVSLSALKLADQLCKDDIYREHVTNFVYENDAIFKINFLKIPFEENKDVRLTIDTREDFELCKDLLDKADSQLPEDLMKCAVENDYLNIMRSQIKLFSK